jgi:hypothetical protein
MSGNDIELLTPMRFNLVNSIFGRRSADGYLLSVRNSFEAVKLR